MAGSILILGGLWLAWYYRNHKGQSHQRFSWRWVGSRFPGAFPPPHLLGSVQIDCTRRETSPKNLTDAYWSVPPPFFFIGVYTPLLEAPPSLIVPATNSTCDISVFLDFYALLVLILSLSLLLCGLNSYPKPIYCPLDTERPTHSFTFTRIPFLFVCFLGLFASAIGLLCPLNIFTAFYPSS